MPTLQTLFDLLCSQPEGEAVRLATALEIYVSGSLNVFNHETNVDLNRHRVFLVKAQVNVHRIDVVDPMGEYSPLIKRLGGQVIEIAPDSPHHINPMDIDLSFDEENPMALKADFILSLQGAVVFLDDTRHREQVIVQLPAGGGHVYHKEGQKEHSFIPAL